MVNTNKINSKIIGCKKKDWKELMRIVTKYKISSILNNDVRMIVCTDVHITASMAFWEEYPLTVTIDFTFVAGNAIQKGLIGW